MNTANIRIEVDEASARAFSQATAEDRRKLQILLALRLRELTVNPIRPLKQVVDDIARHAESRGLSPQILDSLLHDQ